MSSGKRFAALAASLALLTGCGPKQPKSVEPQLAVAPPPQAPARMVTLLSPMPPNLPATPRPLVKLDTNAPPETKVETAKSQPQHPQRHHSNHTVAESSPQEAPKSNSGPSPQSAQTANNQPPEMSPIGQLSTPSDTANAADRRGISDQIDSTENGLNAIKRSFTTDEQKTVTLIRTYITRARDALKADDLDGARTLSNKAKQLLGELTKP
jgi:hypothetical protein